MAKYTPDNRCEIPDNTPVEMPLNYETPESLSDMIKRMIGEQSRIAGSVGLETEEEANDFDVEDDSPMPTSEYQFNDMQEEYLNHGEYGGKTEERGEVKEGEASVQKGTDVVVQKGTEESTVTKT